MSSRGEPAAARDMVARLLLDWSTRFRALTTLFVAKFLLHALSKVKTCLIWQLNRG